MDVGSWVYYELTYEQKEPLAQVSSNYWRNCDDIVLPIVSIFGFFSYAKEQLTP